MYKETKYVNLSATTQIENITVVTMYAQKSETGDVNMNINIQSPTMYEAYQRECDADIARFKESVEKL